MTDRTTPNQRACHRMNQAELAIMPPNLFAFELPGSAICFCNGERAVAKPRRRCRGVCLGEVSTPGATSARAPVPPSGQPSSATHFVVSACPQKQTNEFFCSRTHFSRSELCPPGKRTTTQLTFRASPTSFWFTVQGGSNSAGKAEGLRCEGHGPALVRRRERRFPTIAT